MIGRDDLCLPRRSLSEGGCRPKNNGTRPVRLRSGQAPRVPPIANSRGDVDDNFVKTGHA
jgi:hypothetical protein